MINEYLYKKKEWTLNEFGLISEKKGKPKRSRPKQPESTKKDEDELRKERRKSEAAKKAEEKAAAAAAAAAVNGKPGLFFLYKFQANSNFVCLVDETETIYENEGPKRAPKQASPSVSGESTPTAPGSRKTSQPAIKLDVIDESGGMSARFFQ